MAKTTTMITDLQFGSTGKGLVAGYLAKKEQPDVVVHAFGPNSGHTFVDADGRKFVHRMLANGVVSPRLEVHLIGPGAVVDLVCLGEEINAAKDLLRGKSIYIHRHAVILQNRHKEYEGSSHDMNRIGSTCKGTGQAQVERLERNREDLLAATNRSAVAALAHLTGVDVQVIEHDVYLSVLRHANHVQVEGAQGYSLGVYSGFYPFTTSRECTPAQICADTLVSPSDLTRVVGCMRTYPIRVANRYDEEGRMTGWSGPCYHDQTELSWKELGVPPEYTTVTNLERRVFSFSNQQTREALFVSRPTEVYLGFANYCSLSDLQGIIAAVHEAGRESVGHKIPVSLLSYGPRETDIVDFGSER